MRKILYLAVLLVSAVVMSLPVTTFAATVTFNTDTTLALPNGISLTVLSGSVADALVVNDNSTLTLTVGADTNITIRSTNVYTLTSSGGTTACVGGSYNQITFSGVTAGDYTITVSTATACTVDSGGSGPPAIGGGGGGGGGTAPAAPTGTSVSINAGASQTESTAVTLSLGATNASLMLISNTADFTGAGEWITYATSYPWTLTDGVGTKTVYAKFRSSGGSNSSAVSDTIELVAPAEPSSGSITAGSGGTVSLADGTVSVTVPAGAISADGTLTITPQSDYGTPPSGQQLVGSKAYDLDLSVGDQAVTTFSQPIALTFSYVDSDIAGLTESTLAVYYWDSAASQWVKLGGTVDTAGNSLSVYTSHFTLFAVFGQSANAGRLIKLACPANADVNNPCKAVYYLGSNGKRFVFPNSQTYSTWYTDFSSVETVSAEEMASYMLGGNVTYRPGIKMVKIQTDPKVYAVGANGTLRWLKTEAAATAIYGSSWNTMVDDLSAAFFTDYTVGADIESAAAFDKSAITNAAPNINTDKGL